MSERRDAQETGGRTAGQEASSASVPRTAGALPRWCCAGQPLLPNCVGSRGANSRTRRRDGVGRAPGWLSRGGQGGWRVVAAWRACLPPGAGARAAGRAPPGAAGASPRWLPRCWLVGCRAGALIRSWSWPALSWSTQGGRRSGCGRDAGGGGQDAGRGHQRGRGRCRGGGGGGGRPGGGGWRGCGELGGGRGRACRPGGRADPGRRSVFVLDPTTAVEPQPAEPITP
jgi:translation initiation factor IF-2